MPFKKGITPPPRGPIIEGKIATLNHQLDRAGELGGGERQTPFAFVKVVYPANATKKQREAVERATVEAFEKEHGPLGGAFGFKMVLHDEPKPEKPLVEPATYQKKVELAARDWEAFKRLPGPPPQPAGSTSCDQPQGEPKIDEFKVRLSYPSVRPDADPSVIWPSAPKPDEVKRYAREIAASRTFMRPHERLRTPSVERMIREDHGSGSS
jgi:hypothetical protein